MKLPSNPFTHALKAGDTQIGIWIALANAGCAEVIAHAGYDWALIDMEHSPNDYLSVQGQLQAFAGVDTVPLVRVEWNDTVAVKRLLDLGAPGLLFPMVQSVDEAKAAVAATSYPPRGVRGFAGTARATKFGRITDYATRIEDETTVLLQIESRAALEQAVEIGTVDGVSGIFFGPADIAADIGKLGQPMAPEVWDLIRPAARALIAKGVPVGTLVTDTTFAAELLKDGFTFVACAIDAGLLARAADNTLAAVKAGL